MNQYQKIHLFDRHGLLELTGIYKQEISLIVLIGFPRRLCEKQFFGGTFSFAGNDRN